MLQKMILRVSSLIKMALLSSRAMKYSDGTLSVRVFLSLVGAPAIRYDCHGSAAVIKTGQGALAQYTRVPADQLTHKPTNIEFTHAAGISLAAMTAYQGLRLAQLEAGQTIFINGGSSSVGSFAIQMAKAKGCIVVSSCSTVNLDLVKGLGADEVEDATPFVSRSDSVCATGG